MSGRSLQALLAAAEKRKHDELRARLGIPATITGFQLESLAYLLLERSGPVEVKLSVEAGVDVLRVGEPGGTTSIPLKGEAALFALKAWGIAREAALAGARVELKDGRPVAA